MRLTHLIITRLHRHQENTNNYKNLQIYAANYNTMESEYAAESRIWQKFALHKWQWYDLQLVSGEAWDNEKIQIFNNVYFSHQLSLTGWSQFGGRCA